MILDALTVHNFGPYRDQTVDFRSIRAALVNGQVGAGKSTFFVDAFTWCVWAICRGYTDEMIRPGETDMWVEASITLNHTPYRIIRKRSIKTKAGKSELGLLIGDGAGKWTPISNGIKETEQELKRLLNIDYNTVTASPILVQGQSDQFSRATAGARKSVLADILLLNRYPKLRTAASREITRLESELKTALSALDTATNIANEIPTHHTALQRLLDTRSQYDHTLNELTAREADLIRQDTVTETALQALADAAAAVTTLEQRHLILRNRKTTIERRLAKHEATLKLRPVIEKATTDLELTETKLNTLQDQMKAAQRTRQDLEDELTALQEELTRQQSLQTEIEVKTRAMETLTATRAATLTALETELKHDQQAAELLTQVPCGMELQKQCQFTLQAVQAQARIPDWETKRRAACDPDPTLQKLETERATLQQGLVPLLAKELSTNLAEKHKLRARHLATEKQLDTARMQLETTRKTLQPVANKMSDILQAVQDLPVAHADLKSIEIDLHTLSEDLTIAQGKIAEQPALLARRAELHAQRNTVSAQRAATTATLQALAIEQGATQTKLTEAETVRAQLGDKESLVNQLRLDLHDYTQLHEAYGIIPTLIMENAIPLLEEECNHILGKITTNGCRIRFDTQQEIKSRDGLSETLEIVIQLPIGERRYELYSGGERFQLDLAIRLGLAKLLAHRSGTRIETLIIDEGMGTQDADTLHLLQQCLMQLDQDFKRIIVISHVAGLQGTFPAEFHVSTNGQESTITLLT